MEDIMTNAMENVVENEEVTNEIAETVANNPAMFVGGFGAGALFVGLMGFAFKKLKPLIASKLEEAKVKKEAKKFEKNRDNIEVVDVEVEDVKTEKEDEEK